jgi:hypothetical protein
LGIVHEDVLIKMFRYSIEGKVREWCRYFPPSSISSLKEFHAAFHTYCKEIFSTDFLYDECCEEFERLYFCHINKDENVSFEGTINQYGGFIEHADFSFETTKSSFLPYDVYDHLAFLNHVKEFSS